MVFSDVNKTYVRIKEGDRDIFYIKKSDVGKTFLRDGYIYLIGQKGDEIYKVLWTQVDVYDEELLNYVVRNTETQTTPENTLVAVHNAFFFRDGVGIDLEQLSNIEDIAEPGNGYILVYNSDSNKWVPTAIEFSPEANNLSSNVSGLFKGRLVIQPIVIDNITTYQLVYNDTANNSYNVSFPNYVSETGDIEAITVTAENTETFAIGPGIPIHFTGTSGVKKLEFVMAKASDPSTMPAHGVTTSTVDPGSIGVIAIVGSVSPLNTTAITSAPGTGLSEGDTIYVAPLGGLTTVKPTDASHLVQNIGAVESIDNNNGKIIVTGPGRTNDIPNLGNKQSFIGTSSGGYERRQLRTSDLIEESLLFFTNARARNAISKVSGSKITYDSATGAIGIDDSSYLTSINPADIVDALGGGNGISIDSSGIISIDISGTNLSFDESGALQVTVPANTSDLNNDGDGDSPFATLADLSEFTTGEFKFTQDYTANMPTVGGVVKTFGKYKNGDLIPANNKTVSELLIDAFTDTVAPTPSMVSATTPNYAAESFTISVVFNFGINNNGSSGTATLYYSTDNTNFSSIATYTSADVFFGAGNKTFNHNINRTFAEGNNYYYKVTVVEGTFTRTSGVWTVSHSSYDSPTISNRNVYAVGTGKASGTSGTIREFGDVITRFEYKVRRNEELVGLLNSKVQYNTTGSTYSTITDSISSVVDTLGDNSTSATISFTSAGNEFTYTSNNPNKFRVSVQSDTVPGINVSKFTSDGFSDINYYGAYVICAGPYYNPAGTAPTTAQIQSIFDTKALTTNNFFEYRIKTGSYPGSIGTTSTITEQSGRCVYIIYPGSSPINNVLLDGATGILGTFKNWGQYTLENQFGQDIEYTVYMTSSDNPYNNNFLVIS